MSPANHRTRTSVVKPLVLVALLLCAAGGTSAQGVRADLFLQTGHVAEPKVADISPDGREIVVLGFGAVPDMLVWDMATGRTLAKMPADGALDRLCYAADGRSIVALGFESKLIDRSNSRVLARYPLPKDYAYQSGAVSPDGRSVVIACKYEKLGGRGRTAPRNSLVLVYDLASGRLQNRFELGSRVCIRTCSFGPKSRRVLAAAETGYVTVWDTQKNARLLRFSPLPEAPQEHVSYGIRAVFHPRLDEIVVNHYGDISIWDGSRGRCLRQWHGLHLSRIEISRDGTRLAALLRGCRVAVIDYKTGKTLREIRHRPGVKECVYRFASSAPVLLTCDAFASREYSAATWDLHTGKLQQRIPLMPFSRGQVPNWKRPRFSPDGKRLLLTANGTKSHVNVVDIFSAVKADVETALVWDLESARLVHANELYPDKTLQSSDYNSIQWADKGQAIASAEPWKGKITFRSARTGKVVREIATGHKDVLCFECSPNGRLTVSGGRDGVVLLHEAGKTARRLTVLPGEVRHIAFSADGRRFLAVTDGRSKTPGKAVVWDSATLAPVLEVSGFPNHLHLPVCAINADGTRLLTQTERGIELRPVAKNGLITPFPKGAEAKFASFSPVADLVAIAFEDNSIQLWDVAKGALLHTLRGHTSHGMAELQKIWLEFSPDGKRLVSSTWKDGAILWDVATGRQLARFVARSQGASWLIVTLRGYFTGTEDLLPWVSWRISGQVFPLELYRQKFEDAGEVSRILRGLHERAASRPARIAVPPSVDLSIESLQSRTVKVRVTASGSSPDAPVRRIRLFINGRDVERLEARKLTPEIGKDGVMSVHHEIFIPAHSTKSVIAAVATDAHGTNSPPAARVLVLPGSNSAARRTLYVLSVGVSKYRRSSSNLRFAHADAIALCEVLKAQKGLAFDDVKTRVLTDEHATIPKIRDGLRWLQDKCTRSDTAVVLFTGHGARLNGKLLYVPHEADGHSMSTYLPWNDVAQALQSVKASPVLFLADCCHSGAFGSEPLSQNELARPLLRNSRVMVFSSSRGTEASLEKAALGHGVFTR